MPTNTEVGCAEDEHSAGSDSWAVGERELQELEAFAGTLLATGVGVVACQRIIHPHLRRRLSEKGVLPLERLSALNVAAFQSVGLSTMIHNGSAPNISAQW